jgi:uncharacterized membrane protein YcjF (UPF0283 family)
MKQNREGRYDYLLEEAERRKHSLPQKILAVFALLFSLAAVGSSAGFATAWFIVPALVAALTLGLMGFNAICFRLNLRDAKRAAGLHGLA